MISGDENSDLATVLRTHGHLPRYALRGHLHRLAMQRGADWYRDPINFERVRTEAALAALDPPSLCDHAHERHCPHALPSLLPSPFGGGAAAAADDEDDDDEEDEEDDDIENDTSTAASAALSLSRSGAADGDSSSGSSSGSSGRSGGSSGGGSDRRFRRRIAWRLGVALGKSVNAATALAPPTSAASAIVSPFLRQHSAPLLPRDVPDIEDIRRLPRYSQIGRLHMAAINAGRDCYRDLHSGCLIFTRPFLSRFACCGEDCRHCPFSRRDRIFARIGGGLPLDGDAALSPPSSDSSSSSSSSAASTSSSPVLSD